MKTALAFLLSTCTLFADDAARSQTPPPEPIVYYDMTPLVGLDLNDPANRSRLWDETHLVVSLQGLVNRDAPRLFLRYVQGPDDFWWARMTEPGGWLAGRKVERVANLEELLRRFRSFYQGAVVWDERVPATSNLASTIAGCDNLLCLRFDPAERSLYRKLTQSASPLAVKVRLSAENGSPLFTGNGTIPGTKLPSTGSAKCDAYHWLVEHYLKPGKTDPHRLGYYLDGFWFRCWQVAGPHNHTLTNHDFLIARRGLLFDLNVWDDEACVDDPGQKPGTDAATLRAILRAACDRFRGDGVIHAAGFVPWAMKYTDFKDARWAAGGRHEAVPTEWKYAEILSCFNAFMDADAIGPCAMANASFFQHYPLKDRYPQNPKPTRESLTARGILDRDGKIVPRRYVAHYVGDYDAAAWLYQMLPQIWQDPARGKTPLSWAFNPNLCERFPLGMAWTRENRTPNDFFIAGDSGAGYLNPGLLTPPRPHSGLPSGIAAWERHCRRLYSQWDISLTGFVIDGNGPAISLEGMDAYARFSPDGMVAQKVAPQGVHKGMPYLQMGWDLPDNPQAAASVLRMLASGPKPRFAVCRSILKTPAWYVQVEQSLKDLAGDEVMVVDLYTLLWLVREYETNRARYSDDRFSGVREVTAKPKAPAGLEEIYQPDGRVLIQPGSPPTWLLTGHLPVNYLYFDASGPFYHAGGGPLEIGLEYLDETRDRLGLEYDSTDSAAAFSGAYKIHSQSFQGEATGKWRTAVFRVEDARFAGRQNGGADFRFYWTGKNLKVRKVWVRREGA